LIKFFVKVKAGAKTDRVEVLDETRLNVFVKAPAREGQANAAVLKVLAEHFDVPQMRLSIVKGLASRNKVIAKI
jgi:uncharacterized protein (TIGR00251 family)